jgi:hypothetical protein
MCQVLAYVHAHLNGLCEPNSVAYACLPSQLVCTNLNDLHVLGMPIVVGAVTLMCQLQPMAHWEVDSHW